MIVGIAMTNTEPPSAADEALVGPHVAPLQRAVVELFEWRNNWSFCKYPKFIRSTQETPTTQFLGLKKTAFAISPASR